MNLLVKGRKVGGKKNQAGWKTLVTTERLARNSEAMNSRNRLRPNQKDPLKQKRLEWGTRQSLATT
jgi:hypothetical protein